MPSLKSSPQALRASGRLKVIMPIWSCLSYDTGIGGLRSRERGMAYAWILAYSGLTLQRAICLLWRYPAGEEASACNTSAPLGLFQAILRAVVLVRALSYPRLACIGRWWRASLAVVA